MEEYFYEEYDGSDLVKLGAEVGELVEAIYGKRAADAAMSTIAANIVMQSTNSEPDEAQDYVRSLFGDGWRDLWIALQDPENVSPSEWDRIDTAQLCCELARYGKTGFTEGYDQTIPLTVEQQIREILDWAELFLVKVPATWIAPLDDLPTTIAGALGRWKLDTTREPLTVEEIAALCEVSVKTVRNAMSKGEIRREGSTIPADAAESWLAGMPKFRPSTWRDAAPRPKATPAEGLDNPVFVPFDSDGRGFLPDVKTPGGYVVGAKGSEERFDDYWQALERLQTMEPARWRRPSSGSGRPGIVTEKLWKRISKSEIELMLA